MIFYVFDYPISISPFLQNLIQLDYEVNGTESTIISYNNNSSVHADKNEMRPRKYGLLKSLLKNKRLVRFYRDLLYQSRFPHRLVKYCSALKKINKSSNSERVVVVEKSALLASWLTKSRVDIYISLEVNKIIESETPLEFVLNIFERFYVKNYQPKIISTSEKRLKILTNISNKTLILPVTSEGQIIERDDCSVDFRKKYKIPSESIVVLLAGTLGHSETDLLIKSSSYWNKKFILFLHSSSNEYSSTEFEKLLKKSENIRISKESFNSISEAENYLYSKAQISLIYYPARNSNYRLTAYSSGKIASSTKAGLPIIMPRYEEFLEMNKNLKIGVNENIDSLQKGLELIMKNYDFFSTNSYKAYLNLYSFDVHKDKLLKFLFK